MFDLLFLGTSASVPSPARNQSALLVATPGRRVLIDCGEGTQRQLLTAGAGFRRLDRLLLTHGHLDHMLGIPGLLSTLGLQERQDPMIVNGGPETLKLVADVLAALWGEGRAPIPLELVPLVPGRVAELDGITIDCFPVEHRRTDSFGYVFESSARRHVRRERLTELGVPDGPIRKDLAAGKPVTLPDGRVIDPEDVLGPASPGTKLVVIGDAETTAGLEPFVEAADALVIEATFLERDAETARRHGHLTAAESARLAASTGVKRLILKHISDRYPTEEILAEAQAIFAASHIASDLERITI